PAAERAPGGAGRPAGGGGDLHALAPGPALRARSPRVARRAATRPPLRAAQGQAELRLPAAARGRGGARAGGEPGARPAARLGGARPGGRPAPLRRRRRGGVPAAARTGVRWPGGLLGPDLPPRPGVLLDAGAPPGGPGSAG